MSMKGFDRLKEPTSYFQGVRNAGAAYMDNLIVFRRTKSNRINKDAWKSDLHHRYVFIAVLDGHCRISVDGASHVLSAGEGVVVFPYQLHHYELRGGEERSWLCFSFDCGSSHWLQHLKNRSFALASEQWRSLEEVLGLWLEGEEDTSVRLLLQAALLLQRVSPRTAMRKPSANGSRSPLVDQVHRLLVEAKAEPLSLRSIAEQVGLSESHLRRKFLESSGVSIGKYLRQCRARLAAAQLDAGSMTLTEIAWEYGYGSLANFSRAFRRETGMSPREYRQACSVR
jgi:AraC-like DNA-binding protein